MLIEVFGWMKKYSGLPFSPENVADVARDSVLEVVSTVMLPPPLAMPEIFCPFTYAVFPEEISAAVAVASLVSTKVAVPPLVVGTRIAGTLLYDAPAMDTFCAMLRPLADRQYLGCAIL